MPAKSKHQQIAAAMALKAKRGDLPVSKLSRASLSMYKGMNAEQISHFAKTKRTGLPNKVASFACPNIIKIAAWPKFKAPIERIIGLDRQIKNLHRMSKTRQGTSKWLRVLKNLKAKQAKTFTR